MEGLFDNLEGRSDFQNFEPLTSTLRFSPCIQLQPYEIKTEFQKIQLLFSKFMKRNIIFRYSVEYSVYVSLEILKLVIGTIFHFG